MIWELMRVLKANTVLAIVCLTSHGFYVLLDVVFDILQGLKKNLFLPFHMR